MSARTQERQIGLLAQVVRVEEALLDHHLTRGERECGVGAGPRREPEVGVDRALVVVGRDRDDARAAVARLVQEVRVGDARRRRVEGPQHESVGAEPVVGAAVGVRACRA